MFLPEADFQVAVGVDFKFHDVSGSLALLLFFLCWLQSRQFVVFVGCSIFLVIYNPVEFIAEVPFEENLHLITLTDVIASIFLLDCAIFRIHFNTVYLTMLFSIYLYLEIHLVGSQGSQFYPLVVGVVITDDNRDTEFRILGGIGIYIPVVISRLLAFCLGTIFIERRHHTVYRGGSNRRVGHHRDLGSCSDCNPEGSTRSDGCPFFLVCIPDISFLAGIAPHCHISPVLMLGTFLQGRDIYLGCPEWFLVTADVDSLGTDLSRILGIRSIWILIIMYLSSEIISDGRIRDAVDLGGRIRFEMRNQSEVLADGIGLT